jgi:hypothetical protein
MGSYGPPPKKFVKFKKLKRKPGQKTDRWEIRSHDDIYLGIIRFYPQWRCYISEDAESVRCSGECHDEISKFLLKQTKLWRKSIKKRNSENK